MQIFFYLCSSDLLQKSDSFISLTAETEYAAHTHWLGLAVEQWRSTELKHSWAPSRNYSWKRKTWPWWNIKIWLFWREPECWTMYSSAFFSTGCFLPCPFRVGVVSFVFLQTNRFSYYLCFPSLYVSLPSVTHIAHCQNYRVYTTLLMLLPCRFKNSSSGQPDLSLLSLLLNCVWQVAAGWGQSTMATEHEKSKIIILFPQTERTLV